MDIVQVHLAVVQPFAQRAAVAGLVHLQPGFPHALQRTRSVFRRRGRLGVFVTLNADDVGNQHGMVRGHRAAGLGDHVGCGRPFSSQASPIAQMILLAYSFRP